MRSGAVAVVCLGLALAGGCAGFGPRTGQGGRDHGGTVYRCLRSPAEIEIDGSLMDTGWSRAAVIENFVDISATGLRPDGSSRRPRFKTAVRMLRDDKNLYIAAELEEPNVRARLLDRDSVVYHDNDFEVFIDPDGDGRNYFEIEINAHNTVFDLLLVRSYREGGPARHEWDAAGLRTAVAVDGTLNDASDVDRGWTVEMAIPWSALAEHAGCRVPPRAGDVWRMNFSRVQWPDDLQGGSPELVRRGIEDNWVWSPIGEVDMHVPAKWGWVWFVE